VSEVLGITPERSWKAGDVRRDGEKYGFSSWETGRCDEYDVNVSEQMKKTVATLMGKTDTLNMIREQNNVSFYLEVVPHIYAGETAPCLAPSMDIIDFCHATRTEIDIDTYVYDSKE
jgi:hypothetical protein